MLLITGATGLVGANACRQAVDGGMPVRALVREGSPVGSLRDLGVEIVHGDLGDEAAVRHAADGCDRVLHSAAVLGGPEASASAEAFERINHRGTLHVLDGARAAGARVCLVSTTSILGRGQGRTLTEATPITSPHPRDTAYVSSKRSAFLGGMERAAAGEPITAVFPGAIYGPSPLPERAVAETSFNRLILNAIGGRVPRYPAATFGWVTGADVAAVALAALEHGNAGERFLAMGRQEDALTVPAFLDIACASAGIAHRVAPAGSVADDPSLLDEFGAMARAADIVWPDPLFDASATHARLGDRPTSVADGLAATVAWLQRHGLAPAAA